MHRLFLKKKKDSIFRELFKTPQPVKWINKASLLPEVVLSEESKPKIKIKGSITFSSDSSL